MDHKTVMEYWGRIASIKRWRRFNLLTSEEASRALREAKKRKVQVDAGRYPQSIR